MVIVTPTIFTSEIKKKEMASEKLLPATNDLELLECGICCEVTSLLYLPNCPHSLCPDCYFKIKTRSTLNKCPWCQASLTDCEAQEEPSRPDDTPGTEESLTNWYYGVHRNLCALRIALFTWLILMIVVEEGT